MDQARYIGNVLILTLLFSVIFTPNNFSYGQSDQDSKIDGIIERMSEDQKIGQLLMIGASDNDLKMLVDEYSIGSVILDRANVGLGGDQPQKAKILIKELQGIACNPSKNAGLPLIIAADQEGGSTRLITLGITPLPDAMSIGATRSEEYAFNAGEIAGEELKQIGINMNLAPVADINTNEENDIIGTRSFGGNAEIVKRLSSQYLRGLHSARILSVAKHFPGHGGTTTNPHFGLPSDPRSQDELKEADILPFKALVDLKVDAIMPSLINFMSIPCTPSGLPFGYSRCAISGLIRDYLDYNGVIITDDLVGMEAAHQNSKKNNIDLVAGVKNAVVAGNDLILLQSFHSSGNSYNSTVKGSRAFNEGDLISIISTLKEYFAHNPNQLNESLKRIIKLKLKIKEDLNACDIGVSFDNELPNLITKNKSRVQEIFNNSIILVKDPEGFFNNNSAPFQKFNSNTTILTVVPQIIQDDLTKRIKDLSFDNIQTVALGYKRGRFTEGSKEIFYPLQRPEHATNEKIVTRPEKIDEIVNKAQDKSLIIFGIVTEEHAEMLQEVVSLIALDNKTLIIINFKDPNFVDPDLFSNHTYIAAFSNLTPAYESIIKVLEGQIAPKNISFLPVSMSRGGVFDVNGSKSAKIIPYYDTWDIDELLNEASSVMNSVSSSDLNVTVDKVKELCHFAQNKVDKLSSPEERGEKQEKIDECNKSLTKLLHPNDDEFNILMTDALVLLRKKTLEDAENAKMKCQEAKKLSLLSESLLEIADKCVNDAQAAIDDAKNKSGNEDAKNKRTLITFIVTILAALVVAIVIWYIGRNLYVAIFSFVLVILVSFVFWEKITGQDFLDFVKEKMPSLSSRKDDDQ